jgi:hypothetical protein
MDLDKIVPLYNNINEQNDTLLSILIYKKTVAEVLNYFSAQLERARNITNPLKKNIINNRLYNFIKFVETKYDNENMIINNIFLINDKILEYQLKESEINILIEYDIIKLYMKFDNVFHIDYFYDLLYNLKFIYVMKVNSADCIIYKCNKNKEKKLSQQKISDFKSIILLCDKIRLDETYKDIIYIISTSTPSTLNFNKGHDPKNIIFIKNSIFSRNEIYDLYEKEIYKKNNIELEKRMNELNNEKTNTDLYVFGKLKDVVKDYIETYSIKELYIEEKKIKRLKEITEADCLNFKIIPIISLEEGDIASVFIKNYNGILGIKYF